MSEQGGGRGSLERGLRVIRLLIEVESDPALQHRGLSVQQVSVELGVHKSTASRILRTLPRRVSPSSRQGHVAGTGSVRRSGHGSA